MTTAPGALAAPYRSPLLDRDGAVPGSGIDAGVAAHYGNPLREQRLLDEGLAAVDLSHRAIVTVDGPDRLTWLHSMTTQHVKALAPHQSTESLILSPKGHVEHSLHVVDDGSTTWLSLEPGAASAVTSWLDSMRFMLRVEVADRSDDFAVIGEPLGLSSRPGDDPAWVDPWPRLVWGGETAAYGPDPHPAAGRLWRELIVARSDVAERVGDRPLAGMWAAEALRIAAWRPRAGFETDHRTIVHEVDWLRTAVHLHKGCYRGQETVARVHNLGRPPRRLAFVHLDGSAHTLPERGAAITAGERVVGHLTSVGRHYELGPIGLALVKRSLDPLAMLDVGGYAGTQEIIVTP